MLDETPANTIKDRWLIFVRDVTVTVRAAGSTVRAAGSAVARMYPRPSPVVPSAPTALNFNQRNAVRRKAFDIWALTWQSSLRDRAAGHFVR